MDSLLMEKHMKNFLEKIIKKIPRRKYLKFSSQEEFFRKFKSHCTLNRVSFMKLIRHKIRSNELELHKGST
jgi:hypothetical protein